MKTKPLFIACGPLAFFVVALLFTGCATGSRSDPRTIQVTRSIGLPIESQLVDFFIKRVDDHTYDITAFGIASQPDEVYLKAWVRMADDLAVGRPYEKQVAIGPGRYDLEGGPYRAKEFGVGTMVKGRIVMK